MAVREFDGVDDFIRMDGAYGALNKTLGVTLLAVVRPLSAPSAESVMSMGQGILGTAALYQNTSTDISWGSDDPSADLPMTITVGTAWCIVGLSKAASTSPPTAHHRVLGAGSSTHVTSGTNVAVATGADSSQLYFSRFNSGGGFHDMRLAVAAVFPTALSNAAFDVIAAARTTASINAAGASSIFEFTQASTATAVTDLKGVATQGAITQTTVIADGVDDPSWTYGLTVPAPLRRSPFGL